MTIAKDFASKFSVAFVAIAMLFTLVAPAVNAQESSEDLQKTIADLLKQVAELEGKIGGTTTTTTTTTTSTCDVPLAPLTIGAQGGGVTSLQNILISAGYSIPAGATGYFGAQTRSALAAWQAASNIAPAAGYYGPISMAALQASCSDDATDEDEDEDEDEDDGGPSTDELSGAADLEDFEVDDPSDTEIEEASEDAEIGELTISFENGDAEIDRIEIGLLKDGEINTNTIEPWDTFETISLWVDGDMIEEIDVDDEDFWLDEDLGTIRFAGLSLVAEENEDLVITVGATIQNGLESSELGDWELVAEEVRFFDADGVSDDDSTTDQLNNFVRPFNNAKVSSFEIREEGDEDELFVRTSTEDPESTTIELEDDETSDFTTIFTFDLDTEDSISDIMVEGLRVDVAATSNGTTPTNTSNLINDAQLLVNGEEYDDVTIVHGTPGTFTFDLDDEDFVIEAGERVSVEFQVEFEALTPAFEGATVEATTDTDGLSAEGSENLTVGANQLSGSATGEEHTLRSEGVILALESISETLKVNDDTDTADDEGVFTIKVEVTAFENDIYVNKTANRGTGTTTAGTSFVIEDSNGVETATGAATASLTSTADTEGTRFIVNEGETETFTLTVEYDPATQGFYQLQLHSLNFNVANLNPNTQQRALDESDYETDSLSI